MFKKIHTIIFIIFFINNLKMHAQPMASEMHFSPDKHKLITGNQPYQGFYESDIIHTINIQFSDTGFWNQLLINYQNRIYMPATVTIDGVDYDSVGVRFKGNSSFEDIP